MANNLTSNFTETLARAFSEKFESSRVLTKNVNTQLLAGAYNVSSGDTVSIKRPTDYITQRTSDGDISATTSSDIVVGKASAVVQDYFTVELDYLEADEAIKMDQLDELLSPKVTRVVTDFETDYARFMMANCGLLSGTVGTAVTAWSDVANAGATLQTTGVPKDGQWNYAMNPFTSNALADAVRGLGAGGAAGERIKTALDAAMLNENFAGLRVFSADTLPTYTTDSGADRAGTLSANPIVTYVGAKDTMTQVLPVAAMGANLVIKAGDVLQVTGRNRLNLSTRQAIVDASGANIVFTGVCTTEVTLDGAGAGNVIITGPAIYEVAGQYNTTDSAAIAGDVVTVLGSASSIYQPNLFWHRDAFCLGSVPINKLHSTDTIFETEDGLQVRISKGSSIRENKQIVRCDFRPAYGVLNPFFAGHGWG